MAPKSKSEEKRIASMNEENTSNETAGQNETAEPTPTPMPKTEQQHSEPAEKMVPLSMVQDLIKAEMAKMKDDAGKPVKVKKVTEHTAQVSRFDSKYVVDFVPKNVDEYRKEPIHSWNVYNEKSREWEAWIDLKFEDGSTKELPLKTYCQYRVVLQLLIIERKKIDKSYSIGQVEKKKEQGDKLVGTGVMIDQEVSQYEETFVIKTPEGSTLTLPWYVIG